MMLGIRTLRTAFAKLNFAPASSSLVEGGTKKASVIGVHVPPRPSLAICHPANTCRSVTSWTSNSSSRWPSVTLTPGVTSAPGSGPLSSAAQNQLGSVRCFSTTEVKPASLWQMHRRGPFIKPRKKKNPLGEGKPMAKGVVLKTLIKKPRKPNSANRKCVLLRLSTGKELVAYVPGEGHNLQEHSVVGVRVGRLRDTPGVKVKCIRGLYDLPHVQKKSRV